jgi:hypothetical protein
MPYCNWLLLFLMLILKLILLYKNKITNCSIKIHKNECFNNYIYSNLQ